MLARKCPAINTRVLYLESLQQLASSSVLGSSLATATISADWPEGEVVAEPISMSTPQMNYANENSQNNRKEQRQGNNNNK